MKTERLERLLTKSKYDISLSLNPCVRVWMAGRKNTIPSIGLFINLNYIPLNHMFSLQELVETDFEMEVIQNSKSTIFVMPLIGDDSVLEIRAEKVLSEDEILKVTQEQSVIKQQWESAIKKVYGAMIKEREGLCREISKCQELLIKILQSSSKYTKETLHETAERWKHDTLSGRGRPILRYRLSNEINLIAVQYVAWSILSRASDSRSKTLAADAAYLTETSNSFGASLLPIASFYNNIHTIADTAKEKTKEALQVLIKVSTYSSNFISRFDDLTDKWLQKSKSFYYRT